MFEIVQDDTIGANFAMLLIVKLDSAGQFVGTAHTYLPNGGKVSSTIIIGATYRP